MASQYDDDTDTDWDSAYDEEPDESDQHETFQNSSTRASQESSSTKAREASNDIDRSASSARTQPTHSRQRDSIRAAYDEVSPLLDSEPPPPAYADATAGRPYIGPLASSATNDNPNTNVSSANPRSRSDGSVQGYGSISVQPAIFHPERQPESMSETAGPTTVDDVERGRRGSEPDRKRKRKRFGHGMRKMLFRVALLALLIAAIALLASMTFNDTHSDDDDAGDGRKPSPLIPPNSTFPDAPHSLHCPFEYYSDNMFYEFESPHNFMFVELFEDSSHLSGGIGGLVRITSPLEGQTAAIVVGIGIETTAPWYVSQVNVKQEAEALYLKAPTLLKKSGSVTEKPCMGIYVTIFMRPDVRLSSFEVATENLNLKVDTGLFGGYHEEDVDRLYISNTSEFTVLSGDVSIAHWSSRETRIDVISGSVTGTYDLYDLLSIQTRSGSIDINVDPRPADKTSPAPADFTASSQSGSISVHFHTTEHVAAIPEREYRTHVETRSGTISGKYIHGLTSTFRTLSGSIEVQTLPYSADTYASTLRTETNSGHTKVEILPSFTQPDTAIARLRSLHTSKSSSIHLVYPPQWEGVIDAESVSGSMWLRGKDVVPVKAYKGPVGTHVVAKKGDGKSRVGISTISGSIDATFGDLY